MLLKCYNLQTSNSPSVSILKSLMSKTINNFLKITHQDGNYSQTIKHLTLESFLERIKYYKDKRSFAFNKHFLVLSLKSLHYLKENGN